MSGCVDVACSRPARFRVPETAVHSWGRQGLIKKCYTDSLNRGLWEIPPGKPSARAAAGVELARRGWRQSPRHQEDEVQYEAIALSRGRRGRAGRMAVS
jgi:hypothetical protein